MMGSLACSDNDISENGDVSLNELEVSPGPMLPPSVAPLPGAAEPGPVAVSANKTACQVCNECSPSMRPGSLACEACKKFFMRNYDVTKKFTCDNGGKCLQSGSLANRRSCQACRMERCITLGLSDKVRPPKPAIDLRFVPCAVCGASSTGYHFGILSCEGCKGFFRRTVKYDLAKNFTCDTGGKCVIDPLRQKCKKCRFDRCLSAGMSPTGSHIGRHTNAQRAETKREIERLQNEQKLLKTPIMVRQLKRGAATAALTGVAESPSSDLPSVKLEVTSPSMIAEDGPVKRRPRSRHSSGGSNLTTPQCPAERTTPPQVAGSSQTSRQGDFILPSKNASLEAPTQPAASQPRVDDATLAAAQSLMSIFGTNSLPAMDSQSYQPKSVPEPPQPESGFGNFSGVSSFLARLNAQAAAMAASSMAPSPSASTCSTFDLTTAQPALSPMFSMLPPYPYEDNTRAAVLRRIRMPVPKSNYIWIYNSGADWVNIANLLANPPPPTPMLQNQLRPIGDPFSLQTFIRMLDSEQLLPEPPLAVFPRSEWLLAQVTSAVRNLSHIRNLRLNFDPGWTAEEVWGQGMVCFEHHTRYVLAFVRSLPGYAALSALDRTTLFKAALFPLTVAQLSLDYDMQEHEENYLSMDHIGRELMSLHFPPMRQLRRHVHDAGLGIKSAKLNIVEFGLISALVFFNGDIPNLVETDKVRQICEEFRIAASIFVRRTWSSDPPAASSSVQMQSSDRRLSPDERLDFVFTHARYLSTLHQSHQSVIEDFGRMFPHLVNLNPLHLEIYSPSDPTSPQPPPTS